MKLDHLRYFLAAATHGSFTAAGLKMHISPTSVGHAVNMLEEQLGTALFVRKPSRGLTLTADGQKLYQQCRQVLSDLEALQDQFVGAADQFRGELIIGSQEGLIWSLLARAISKLAERQPELRVSMKTTSLATNYEELEEGEIDVLITFRYDDIAPANVDVTTLCRPEVCVLMRKGHPLDTCDEKVSLKDLARYKQVMNNEPNAFDLAYNAYRALGYAPEVLFSSNIASGAQALVGQSDAVSLRVVRSCSMVSPLGDQLTYKRIADEFFNPYLVAAKVKSRTIGVRNKSDAFIDVCKELMASGEMRDHLYY
ncbi:MAG: LysR family transcriptional regulator [Alphaproteobacteria bacterium]|nr:LysR family transcriptional regulator [Alphaproteobacteria bacterium]